MSQIRGKWTIPFENVDRLPSGSVIRSARPDAVCFYKHSDGAWIVFGYEHVLTTSDLHRDAPVIVLDAPDMIAGQFADLLAPSDRPAYWASKTDEFWNLVGDDS
jgi:hypothetical protein